MLSGEPCHGRNYPLEILRLWFTVISVQAIARWEEIRKRRDISTMPETNMTVPQKNLKNVIKAGSCLTI